MPLEGTENLSNTSDATDKNTVTNTNTDTTTTQAKGTEDTSTQDVKTAEAQDKKFTQADVDRMIKNRISSGVKAELKKLTGDPEGGVTLESLQQQLTDERTARQSLEAKQDVRSFAVDPVNQFNIPPSNMSAIEELVHARLEYQDGKPTNLKEAFAAVKGIAPTLFAVQPTNIDAGAGRRAATGPVDMNKLMRDLAARKNNLAN